MRLAGQEELSIPAARRGSETGHIILLGSAVLVMVVLALFAIQLATVRTEHVVVFSTFPSPHRTPLTVEVADNFLKQQVGLSSEKSIPSDYGMLFAFGDEGRRFFRARDYQFPLDVLFLDREGKVTAIVADVPVCGQLVCTYADSIEPTAKYMLIVNAGFTASNSIREGDFVTIPGGL